MVKFFLFVFSATVLGIPSSHGTSSSSSEEQQVMSECEPCTEKCKPFCNLYTQQLIDCCIKHYAMLDQNAGNEARELLAHNYRRDVYDADTDRLVAEPDLILDANTVQEDDGGFEDEAVDDKTVLLPSPIFVGSGESAGDLVNFDSVGDLALKTRDPSSAPMTLDKRTIDSLATDSYVAPEPDEAHSYQAATRSYYDEQQKRNALHNTMRLGKRDAFGSTMRLGKRSSIGATMRLGKRDAFGSTMRLGKRNTVGATMRLGKRDAFGSTMRLGKRSPMGSTMRLGKRDVFGNTMRLGKRDAFGSTMRLGKRDAFGSTMRLGKRGEEVGSMMRFGKREPLGSTMRLGKRESFGSTMRLGKREPLGSTMRLGKREALGSTMRLGKRESFGSTMRLGKREALGSTMRLGKRESFGSTMRLGKREAMGSTMRLGKRESFGSPMRFGKREALGSTMRLGKRDFLDSTMRLGKRVPSYSIDDDHDSIPMGNQALFHNPSLMITNDDVSEDSQEDLANQEVSVNENTWRYLIKRLTLYLNSLSDQQTLTEEGKRNADGIHGLQSLVRLG